MRISTLQLSILTYLKNGPVPTVTALAERLHALRPAVSRSLHALEQQGLVARQGRSWHLTESGSSTVDAELPIRLQRLEATAKRLQRLLQ